MQTPYSAEVADVPRHCEGLRRCGRFLHSLDVAFPHDLLTPHHTSAKPRSLWTLQTWQLFSLLLSARSSFQRTFRVNYAFHQASDLPRQPSTEPPPSKKGGRMGCSCEWGKEIEFQLKRARKTSTGYRLHSTFKFKKQNLRNFYPPGRDVNKE